MRKILVAGTALVAVSMLSSGAMAADKVKLELGGYTKWFVVGAWQSNSFERATNQSFNNVDIKGRSDITFSGSTKLDNGLNVGVFTAMRGGTNTGVGVDGSPQGDSENLIDQAYLHVASAYGKVMIGVVSNGTHLLHVQAPESISQWNHEGLMTGNAVIQPARRATGSGGNNTLPVLGINGNGIHSTSILPGNSSGKQETITYIAPTFYGFTVGGSYIPNTAKNVRGPVDTGGIIHDIFGVGVNYTNKFDDLGVKASFGWARGSLGAGWKTGNNVGSTAFSLEGQNANFFNAGLNLSYAGFTLGGSFRWNMQDVRRGGIGSAIVGIPAYSINGHAWDAGLMYASGPWAASVSYFGSQVDGFSRTNWGKKEEITFLQTSGKYDLGPGVALQALVGYGDYQGSNQGSVVRDGRNDNKGWTAMTGVQVNF